MNARSTPAYSLLDYSDMMILMWRNNCTHEEAARLYAENYPQRDLHPDAETMALIERTLKAKESLAEICQDPEVIRQAAERARRNRASKANVEGQ